MTDKWIAAPARPRARTLEQAWRTYYSTIAEMHELTVRTDRFRNTPEHRAKGYHALMEAQAMAYNFAIAPRRHHPRIQVNTIWQTDVYTLGQNAPDFFYGTIILDGRRKYRMTGRYGDVILLLVQVHNQLASHIDATQTGSYDLSGFEIDADGSFEVLLSATRQPGNWISLDPSSGYNFVFIRRAMRDWNDDPGELNIALIDDASGDDYPGDEFDEGLLAERVVWASDWFRYIVEIWNVGLYEVYLDSVGRRKNVLSLLPGTATSQVGTPLARYAMGVFELADDEALVIELNEIPDGVYWSLQLGDVWSRSLNFMDYQSTISMHHAAIDSDGKFRAIVSHKDCGYANWLDPTGHHEGTIVFRNYRALTSSVPIVRRLRLRELDAYLPKDTPRVSPSQRCEALRRRRKGFHKLHGE